MVLSSLRRQDIGNDGTKIKIRSLRSRARLYVCFFFLVPLHIFFFWRPDGATSGERYGRCRVHEDEASLSGDLNERRERTRRSTQSFPSLSCRGEGIFFPWHVFFYDLPHLFDPDQPYGVFVPFFSRGLLEIKSMSKHFKTVPSSLSVVGVDVDVWYLATSRSSALQIDRRAPKAKSIYIQLLLLNLCNPVLMLYVCTRQVLR